MRWVRGSVRAGAPDTLTDPEDDPTAFAEAEDFDMGLFVANVAGDPGRREAVYR
ncbi:hypothetical protein HCK01_24355 [Streptomyces sp. AA8]|nr:hypothetical protein [Streptomyces telluris]